MSQLALEVEREVEHLTFPNILREERYMAFRIQMLLV